MIINYLQTNISQNGSSLTITTFHPSLHNYQRMLTLLSIPQSLKRISIINTLDSDKCHQLIGSIIGRNSCTLTSMDLSFDTEWRDEATHSTELNLLYFSISMCSLSNHNSKDWQWMSTVTNQTKVILPWRSRCFA
jgi:hypothetical protein